jgi:hypothetical protein
MQDRESAERVGFLLPRDPGGWALAYSAHVVAPVLKLSVRHLVENLHKTLRMFPRLRVSQTNSRFWLSYAMRVLSPNKNFKL